MRRVSEETPGHAVGIRSSFPILKWLDLLTWEKAELWNERITSEEGVCLLTLFLNKKQQEKFNININFKNKRTMNKRIFRKIRVIGDVIMVVDIACHAYRLVKKEIYPWICKKIHKNTGAAEEVDAPTTTTESIAPNVNEQQWSNRDTHNLLRSRTSGLESTKKTQGDSGQSKVQIPIVFNF